MQIVNFILSLFHSKKQRNENVRGSVYTTFNDTRNAIGAVIHSRLLTMHQNIPVEYNVLRDLDAPPMTVMLPLELTLANQRLHKLHPEWPSRYYHLKSVGMSFHKIQYDAAIRRVSVDYVRS